MRNGWCDVEPQQTRFFTFGVLTSVQILVKINQEMQPWESAQTDTLTDRQTQTSFIICAMLYAISIGRIIYNNQMETESTVGKFPCWVQLVVIPVSVTAVCAAVSVADDQSPRVVPPPNNHINTWLHTVFSEHELKNLQNHQYFSRRLPDFAKIS